MPDERVNFLQEIMSDHATYQHFIKVALDLKIAEGRKTADKEFAQMAKDIEKETLPMYDGPLLAQYVIDHVDAGDRIAVSGELDQIVQRLTIYVSEQIEGGKKRVNEIENEMTLTRQGFRFTAGPSDLTRKRLDKLIAFLRKKR